MTLNGKMPLSARCRIVPGGTGIRLCSESRDISSGALTFTQKVHLKFIKDLSNFNNPRASCALLKCALLTCRLLDLKCFTAGGDETGTQSLQPHIKKLCRTDEQIGLEIITTSQLVSLIWIWNNIIHSL